MRSTKRCSAALLSTALIGTGAVALAPAASAAPGGVLLYGVTSGDHLVSFRAQTPGTLATDVAVTGLAAGEHLAGLDVRPATGGVHALTDTGRLLTLDVATGAATVIGPVTPAFTGGAAVGVDFNPVPDRLRVVGANDQDLRVVPTTGAATVDTTLAYAAGDVHAGADPGVQAAAYTNSVAGATTTTLYDIDTTLDVLVKQDPPNNGTLNTVGDLGVDVTGVAGLDIDAASGTAWAVLETATGTALYTVDLASGAATAVGATAPGVTDVTVATPRLRALPANAQEGSSAPVTLSRTGDLADPATVDYATSDGTATAGQDYTSTSGTATFAAGQATATVTVPVAADLVTEGAETVRLTLSAASAGAVLSPATSTLTLTETATAYALTTANEVVSFPVSSPATPTSTVAVSGLGGEDLLGIDVRPANGLLYAVTSGSRLVTIDPATGASTVVGTLSVALSGSTFGVDVNPVADRLRVVSDTGQSLRIDMTTAIVTTDTPLNPGSPQVVGAGYTNDVAGATTTALYDIDSGTDQLLKQDPPNAGTLTAVGPLGVDVTAGGDLDVAAAGGTAFAALTPTGGAPTLYRVDLTTGALTALGAFAPTTVEDLALASPGRLSVAPVTVGEQDGSATVTVSRTAGSSGPVTVAYATNDGTAKAGQDYTTTSGTLALAAGQTTATFAVPVLQDTATEGSEALTVTLSAPQGGASLLSASAPVTVVDDDNGLAYALTAGDHVATVYALQPAAAPVRDVVVSGLAAGEHLLGIDVRPATGVLLGLTSTGRVLALDPQTGSSQLLSTSSVALSGTAFAVDVNPVADRLRVISDTGQSLRINVDTGAAVVDTSLAYASGDAGAGSVPAVTAAGYTGSVAGAKSTALYDLDTARDTLVLQSPPNDGTLTTVGPLGVDAGALAGLDIAPGGSAFAVLRTPTTGPSVYRVDLTTGAASLVGALSVTDVVDLAFPTPPAARAGLFHALSPARVLDTRGAAPVSAGAPRTVPIAGLGGVPSTGVSAVVLNVTSVGSSVTGNLSVFPSGQQPATRTSNLNWQRGQTVAVQVQVGLGTDGAVQALLNTGTTDLLVDVLGWYGDASDTTGSGFRPLVPQRLLDTRLTGGDVSAGAPRGLAVTGVGGVPVGAVAVALNVTVTRASGTLNLEVRPGTGGATPRTSNLNVVSGQTVANAVAVRTGDDGQVLLSVNAGHAVVVVDVVGYWGPTASGRFVPVTPSRLLDTRTGGGQVTPAADRVVTVQGAGGVPATAVGAVLSVTGTGTTGPNNVAVLPTGVTQTGRTSTLNLVPRSDVPNLAMTPLGQGGAVSLRVSQFSTDLVVDVTGYLLPS